MAREKEHYRDVLATLIELSGGKMLLTRTDVSRMFKITIHRASDMYFKQGERQLEITKLASRIL